MKGIRATGMLVVSVRLIIHMYMITIRINDNSTLATKTLAVRHCTTDRLGPSTDELTTDVKEALQAPTIFTHVHRYVIFLDSTSIYITLHAIITSVHIRINVCTKGSREMRARTSRGLSPRCPLFTQLPSLQSSSVTLYRFS